MARITEKTVDTQTYQLYIRATPEAIWDAITKSEWTQQYGYRGRVDYELRTGGTYCAYATEAMVACGAPDVIIEGEVVEADVPRRLVQTWNPLFDPQITAEASTTLTFEIEPAEGGFTKLTVTHELGGAPTTAALVSGSVPDTGGGWPFVLSDLKSLLETGKQLAA
ncbi:MAG TPA: SRPBCC family protein [Gaiellaceae bacterium]